MTVLMMISLTVVAIYAYVMRRLWIKSWFREAHSNTFLKKLKSEASKIERITGFYLLRAEKRKESMIGWHCTSFMQTWSAFPCL